MKCIRDVHMFSGSIKATHEVTRRYGEGSFHKFHVCSNCLPLLVKDADQYSVAIEVKELEDEAR